LRYISLNVVCQDKLMQKGGYHIDIMIDTRKSTWPVTRKENIMGSDEQIVGPILAHDIFLLAASQKKPAFLADVGYVKTFNNP